MEIDEVGDTAAVDDPVEGVAERTAKDQAKDRIRANVGWVAHDIDDQPDRNHERCGQEHPRTNRGEAEGRARIADVGDAHQVAQHRDLGAIGNRRVHDALRYPVENDHDHRDHDENHATRVGRPQVRLSPIQICSPSSINCSPSQPSPLPGSIVTDSVSFLM